MKNAVLEMGKLIAKLANETEGGVSVSESKVEDGLYFVSFNSKHVTVGLIELQKVDGETIALELLTSRGS